MTLESLVQHFFALYGRRNCLFFKSLQDRIDFLNIGIGDLQDAVRKGHTPQQTIALARVFSRICCVAQHFQQLPLTSALSRKYPFAGCSYCQTPTCTCDPTRPDPTIGTKPDGQQEHFTLSSWCDHLGSVYGKANRAKGIENLLNRLFKEVSELSILAKRTSGNIDQLEESFAFELADTLAWTIAVANELGISLEDAVLDRYENGCSACQHNPCGCAQFNFEPVPAAALA